MKWLTIKGRPKEIATASYKVDWDGKQGSKFAAQVLTWFKPYWRGDVVLAEFPVPGTKSRFDYVNLSKKIILEVDGDQHGEYSPHWHKGSRANYLGQIKRDLEKDSIAEINLFKMVRITTADLPLTKEWLEKTFNITL